jgi:LysM repeat protein
MTRRQVSILIILAMANYLLLNSFIRLIIEASKPAPTPTRTPRPVSIATPVSVAAQGTPSPLAATPVGPTPTNTLVIKPTPKARRERVTHTVQPGETLADIAALYGSLPEDIMNLNGLRAPNIIQPGQQLTIPAPGEVVPTLRARPQDEATAPPPRGDKPPRTPAAPRETPTATPLPTVATPHCAHVFCAEPSRYGEIGKGITQFKGHFKDAQGNPLDGYFVMLSCPGDYHVLSSPSGPWSQDTGKEPGLWEITLRAEPMDIDCTLQAVMYKCSEWFNAQCGAVAPLSEIAPVHTSAASGETIVILDWVCYGNCLPGIKG